MKSNFKRCVLTVICFAAIAHHHARSQNDPPSSAATMELINQMDIIFDEITIHPTITSNSNLITINEPTVKVLPTPATDHIYIQSDIQNFDGHHFSILASDGKKVLDGSLNESRKFVELSSLQPGAYILQLTQENKPIHNPMKFTIVK